MKCYDVLGADRHSYILSYEPVKPMAFLHQAYTPRCCI